MQSCLLSTATTTITAAAAATTEFELAELTVRVKGEDAARSEVVDEYTTLRPGVTLTDVRLTVQSAHYTRVRPTATAATAVAHPLTHTHTHAEHALCWRRVVVVS